jgi:hypothetical protein
MSKLKSASSASGAAATVHQHYALDKIDINLAHQFDQLHDQGGNNLSGLKNNHDSSQVNCSKEHDSSSRAFAAMDNATKESSTSQPALNPDETLAELANIDDIMEWQEILNAVAKEESQAHEEDTALLGIYDSEDEECLAAAVTATNFERMLHSTENKAVNDHEDELLQALKEANLLYVLNSEDVLNSDDVPFKEPILEGAPVGWKIPGPPKNYKKQKDPPSVPAFENIDNPGFGDDYVFQLKYNKKKNYLGYSLPTGAMPVPEKKGKRQCNGWEFHYQGYKGDTNFRDGASKDLFLFPEQQKGKLDANLLVKLGMSKERLVQEDFLINVT